MSGQPDRRVWLLLGIAFAITGCGSDGDEVGFKSVPQPAATSSWTSLAPLGGGPRQECGVAELNGEIYVVGGFVANGASVPAVEAYNPSTDTWRPVAPLPVPLHHVNVASVRGRLYVVGALEGAAFLPTGRTLEYNPTTNRWIDLAPMPPGSERGASGVGVVGNLIYVAGGFGAAGSVDTFSSFDPALNIWTPLQNMPTARDHLAGASVAGRVFAIGGRNAGGLRGEVEIYDPQSAIWTFGAPMPTPRGGLIGGAVNNRIYLMGGEGNAAAANGIFDQNEVYDPLANSWRSLEPMLTPRHGTAAAGLNGQLYVPGGADRQGLGPVSTNEVFTP